MDSRGRTLTVTHLQAIAYNARADGTKVGADNFLVKLRATSDKDTQIVGFGECQPRQAATGDRNEGSWSFLAACLRRLHERTIDVADPRAAVAQVRELMDEVRALAAEFVDEGHALAPFRGTLLGLEVALLDLVARALDMPVATLLGSRRSRVPAHAAPIPTGTDSHELPELMRARDGNAPVTRLHGRHGAEESIALLESAARINNGDDAQQGKPLWIDMHGKLNRADASAFINAVVNSISAKRLPREVMIEQPIPARERYFLPVLQRKADKAAASSRRAGVEVRIVADQGSWNRTSMGRRAKLVHHIGRLAGMRGPRAAFIKPPQVGGVLGCLDLAETIRASNPDARIYLGGMDGATEVTAGMLQNLAMAMPELDAVADGRLARGAEVTAPTEPGIGVEPSYVDIIGDTTDCVTLPEPPVAHYDGKAPNTYGEVDYVKSLGSNGTKGHLLEREALIRGLSTTRYSKGAFVTTDGVHSPLSFKWSRSPLSSAVSLALCTHKEATRMRLRRAEVPVPQGCTFSEGEYAEARAFVKRIGYPVVVKPAMGVRGIGVVANIEDDEALEQAFENLAASTLGRGDFIVEQHVPGRDYRIVVIGNEVIGAILREPGSVSGDGESTVAELVIAKNAARRGNPHLWGRPIKYDDAARFQLERAGLGLGSVPERGRQVLLSGSCSLSQGGDSIDVLDEMHPSIKEACVRAVRAIPGLAFCGVDFLLEDHTKPLDEQQSGICELNAHAAIGNCEYPLYGTPREVARTLMDECVTRSGLITTERQATLALRLLVRGRVTGVGYRAWIQRHARQHRVHGWVRNLHERQVEIVIEGDAEPVTTLAALAVLGPKAAKPTDVSTTHIEPLGRTGFELVTEAPKEHANAR